MFSLTRADGYLLTTDPARIDLDLVHRWLSTDAYWALGRDRETVVRAFAGSLPFGVYRPSDGRQVAVARVVTDGATFAWLCDVYVDRAERGRGWAAGWPARSATTWPSWAYAGSCWPRNDAHQVYARVGFTPLDVPERWMNLDQRPGDPGHRKGTERQFTPYGGSVTQLRRGYLYGFGAYLLWGFFPLYLKLLRPGRAAGDPRPPDRLVGASSWPCCWARCATSASCGRCCAGPGRWPGSSLAAALIAVNWGTYIYGVNSGPGRGDRARLLHQPAGRRCCSG